VSTGKALIWASFNQFGVQIINFIVTLLLTRLLSPKEVGTIALISILIAIGSMLINSGLTQSLLRTPNINENDYANIFYINLIISVIIYLLVFFLSPIISSFYNLEILKNIIRVFSLTFIFNAICNVQITRLTVEMNFKMQSLVTIPASFISGLIGIFMAYKGFGVWSLVWSQVSNPFFITIFLLYFTKWKPKFNFNIEIIKKHWNFGYKLMLAGLIDSFFTNFYSSLIGKKFNLIEAGLFYRADTVKQLPLSNLTLILNKILFPILTPLQNDIEHFKEKSILILKTIIFFVFPFFIFSSIFAEPIFKILFTVKWLGSVKYFQLLCFSALLYPVHIFNLTILNIKGKSDKVFFLQIIKTIISVTLILIFIGFGVIGLMYGLIIESVLAFFLNSYFLKKIINFGPIDQLKEMLPIILISLIYGVFTIYLNQIAIKINFNDFIRILICGLISLSFYYLLSIIFLKQILHNIKKLILN
jgi:O-antigen/teichoic acid export membrane protein